MILITGGAGYIGSHVVRMLSDQGESVMVLDDCSTGTLQSISSVPIIDGDVGDTTLLATIFKNYDIEGVIHLAAKTNASDSVNEPAQYYLENTIKTNYLLQAALKAHVRFFIFSSTAAVYGNPADTAADELSTTNPVNPYGWSKLMAERMIQDITRVNQMKYLILRYFNVAGADPNHQFGPFYKHSTLLFRVLAQVALGVRDKLIIYGDQYPTKDGTALRDYLHVCDVAKAHYDGVRYLRHGGASSILNCGYGNGFTVKEVLHIFEEVLGRPIAHTIVSARPGEAAAVVAKSELIKKLLVWQPQYDNLKQIVRDTLEWEKRLWQL